MENSNLSPVDMLLMNSCLSSKHEPIRSTRIIVTISPELQKEEVSRMIEAGFNIARFKASKGKEFKHIESDLKTFRDAVNDYNEKNQSEGDANPKRLKFQCATAIELKGSFFKTGTFTNPENKAIELLAGNKIKLTTSSRCKDNIDDEWIYVNCSRLMFIKPNQIIILNKTIKLIVESVNDQTDLKFINCRILNQGSLNVNDVPAEVNIPGMNMNFGVPEETEDAIKFCHNQSIDMLFVPVNDPEVLKIVKFLVKAEGKSTQLKVIAKLEDEKAIFNIDEIIKRADGVMLSRNRIRRNMQSGQLSIHQNNILAKCLISGVPTIVASNILVSMKDKSSRGSRAELDDIFSTVLGGSDCLMLGRKVSTSACINVLEQTIMKAEDTIDHRNQYWMFLNQSVLPSPIQIYDFTNVTANTACTAAMLSGANAIVVLTETGNTVGMISKHRPACPIIAVASSAAVARHCCLFSGVFSIQFDGEFYKICNIYCYNI